MAEINLKQAEYTAEIVKKSGVRNMLPEEQPREKLMKYGPDVLTDSELLAILLRSGTQGMNVMEVSRTLLERSGGIHKLARHDWEEISGIRGIGKVKAITLVAVFELARRLSQDSEEEKIFFYYPEQVYSYFGPMLRDQQKEIFIVGYLNSAKQLTGYDRISVGGANATIVDPNEVLRKAIINRAHNIMLVHNHPSGNPRPSQADSKLTKRIQTGARMVGMDVADHVIIAGYEWTSFKKLSIID